MKAIEDPALPRLCVLLPCSEQEHWAVPQNCVAEIVTVSSNSAGPPASIPWRGLTLPVRDLGETDGPRWSDRHSGTGLVAVLLGIRDSDGSHWGLALRGEGLGFRAIADQEMESVETGVQAHALAAFRYRGQTYQVPDLRALQASS